MPKSDFTEYVVHDLLSELRGIRSRALFGGYGIYRDDIIFAIIVDDQLYFKVGDANRKEYQKRGSQPFKYQSSRGKSVALSYWEVPADIMDNREEIKLWAERSFQVSHQLRQQAVSRTKRNRVPSQKGQIAGTIGERSPHDQRTL